MPDAVLGKITRVGVHTGLIQAKVGRFVEEVHISNESDHLKCRDLSLKYSVGESVAFFFSSRQGKFAKVKEAGFVCLLRDLHEGGAKVSLVATTHATAATVDSQEIYMAANRLSHEFPRGAKQQTSQLDLTMLLSVGDRIEFKAAEQVTSVQWRATWVRLVGRVTEQHDGPNTMTQPKLPLYGYEHFGIFEASTPPPQPSNHHQPTAACQQQLISYADLSNFSSEENIINDEGTGVSDFYRPITSSPRVEKEVPKRETSRCRRRRWDETPETAEREERKRRRRRGEESDTSRDSRSRRRKLSRRREKADAATQTNGEATSTELEQLRIDGSELRRSLLSIGNQQLTDLSVILLKALSSLSPSTTDQQQQEH